ncbi:hypothetical protein B0J13DRAFT_610922 [Dactylonectria estremocensis]|uniref:F-box domain-containing protein n=1 Tax=Dactylonectria estremocensis TaxID=1079267 RepID=A0A9P9E2R2_9HYPO|nr:hypothetical protein B0J13DRAFT_610922 [Dactylonectria estremocensis]
MNRRYAAVNKTNHHSNNTQLSMDHLSNLPPLLLGEILQHIPNFETLHAAITASPATYRVFRDQGPAIIHAVATNILEPELHQILYSIALIRNQPVSRSITTLDSFAQNYVPDLITPKRPTTPLSVDTRPQVCFGLVTTVVNINRLAIAVLGEFLHRTAKLKPQHCVSRTVDFASGAYSQNAGSDPWPAGQAAPIAPSATERPPSWVEGYRVQRALWLIQLALEVRSSAPWVVWGANQITVSQNREWSVGKISPWLSLAIDASTIAKMLEDVIAPRVVPDWDDVPSSTPIFVALTKMPRCAASHNSGPALSEEPRDDVIGMGWSQNRDAVRTPSDGRRIFGQLLMNRHVSLNKSIVQTAMQSGLMIWDRERLCDLGLMDELHGDSAEDRWWENEVRRPQMSEDEIGYAWYSIGMSYCEDE